MALDPLVFRDLAYVFVAAGIGSAAAWLGRLRRWRSPDRPVQARPNGVGPPRTLSRPLTGLTLLLQNRASSDPISNLSSSRCTD